jgi:probable HAF family extracellular repeat protein
MNVCRGDFVMMHHRDRAAVSVNVLPLALLLACGPCLAQKYSVTTLSALPGGTNASATSMSNAGLVAINNQGVIIGDARDSEAGVFEIGPSVSGGRYLDLGISVSAISDTNVVVGDFASHPVIRAGEDISQYPNGGLASTANNIGAYTYGSGINSAGVIVGTEYDDLPDGSDSYPIVVRWNLDPTTGTLGSNVQALSGLGGRDSGASSVNAKGSIAGWATFGNKRMHAVLWGPHTGAFDLGTLGGN